MPVLQLKMYNSHGRHIQEKMADLTSPTSSKEFKLVKKLLIKKIPRHMASLVNFTKQLRTYIQDTQGILTLNNKETKNPI